MNTKRFLIAVSEFHRAFNHRQPEPRIPDLSDKKTNELRPALIKEELLELRDAVDANDRLEQLDALCDAQYVLSGTVLDWGYRELFLARSHSVSMRPIRDMTQHIAGMLGVVNGMEISAEKDYQNQVWTDLVALQNCLLCAIQNLGFSEVFAEAFEVVHQNNMGKIWSDAQKRAATSEPGYLKDLGIDSVRFDKSPNGWIARRDDGKILKPKGFVKVSLERFV